MLGRRVFRATQGPLKPAAGLQLSTYTFGKVSDRLEAGLTQQSILTLRLMSFRSTSCPSRMPVTSACTISLMALTLACRGRHEGCWRAWLADACAQHEHAQCWQSTVPLQGRARRCSAPHALHRLACMNGNVQAKLYLFGRQDCCFRLHG